MSWWWCLVLDRCGALSGHKVPCGGRSSIALLYCWAVHGPASSFSLAPGDVPSLFFSVPEVPVVIETGSGPGKPQWWWLQYLLRWAQLCLPLCGKEFEGEGAGIKEQQALFLSVLLYSSEVRLKMQVNWRALGNLVSCKESRNVFLMWNHVGVA